ncbi:MAG: TrmH family RNA methyltransferase [Planctomycetota bacterium]|jgi:TrmH family RNA methyltransferase
MSRDRITSPQNPRLKSWVLLQRDGNARRERREFVLEGRRLVETALELGRVKTLLYSEKFIVRSGARSGARPDVAGEDAVLENAILEDPVLKDARSRGIECVELSMAAFRKLADVPSPQGVAVVAELPSFSPRDVFGSAALLLVAAGVQEPGNLGSMLRTCLAAGATGLVALAPSADVFHPRSVRGSAGAVLALPSIRMSEDEFLETARASRLRLVAAVPRGGVDFRSADWSRPCALVIGSEGAGVGERLTSRATAVTIPMRGGTESLNAAAAAAVLLFEATR